MSEEFLDDTDVGPPFEHVGGTGVPEDVGANSFVEATTQCVPPHYLKHPLAREASASRVQKDRVDVVTATWPFDLERSPASRGQPLIERVPGDAAERYETLLGTLAVESDKFLVPQDVAEVEPDDF